MNKAESLIQTPYSGEEEIHCKHHGAHIILGPSTWTPGPNEARHHVMCLPLLDSPFDSVLVASSSTRVPTGT